MFRYKQSSLIGSLGIKNSSVHILKGAGDACIGLALNASHFFMPFQCCTGCGAFHLNSPTGGAANGMPLKICMSPALFGIPETTPASVFTFRSLFCAYEILNANSKKQKSYNFRFIIYLPVV